MFPYFCNFEGTFFKQMDSQIPNKTKGGHLRFLELKKLEIF